MRGLSERHRTTIDGVEGWKSCARIEEITQPVRAFDIWDTADCGEVDEKPHNGLTPRSLDFDLSPSRLI
ncbi:MAG: hypothetical protein D6728_00730 [Cyanobacteria bacterium J055]|nr:MAG: hypothetical protein D6728_00730 [Cyanobacteria bacterium J055]